MNWNTHKLLVMLASMMALASCDKNDNNMVLQPNAISIENVLDSKPLVESGTFKGAGTPPVILPGQSVSFSFSAAKKSVAYLCVYVWLEQ